MRSLRRALAFHHHGTVQAQGTYKATWIWVASLDSKSYQPQKLLSYGAELKKISDQFSQLLPLSPFTMRFSLSLVLAGLALESTVAVPSPPLEGRATCVCPFVPLALNLA